MNDDAKDEEEAVTTTMSSRRRRPFAARAKVAEVKRVFVRKNDDFFNEHEHRVGVVVVVISKCVSLFLSLFLSKVALARLRANFCCALSDASAEFRRV